MANGMEYDIVVTDGKNYAIIDWGNEPGWAEKHRPILDNANAIAFVPKEGIKLPAVSVDLKDGKRWVAFSRVYGQVTSGREIRLYAIGWQKTTADGFAMKSITWVYPDGNIEVCEEPGFVRMYLK